MTVITVLADNKVGVMRPVGLLAEWGFSAAVGEVLFDTGLTGAAHQNAVKLGFDPAEFEAIVLSHGHHDHTAGIEDFLIDEPEVYMHPQAWEPRYKLGVHNGMPFTRERIRDGGEVVEHREPIEVRPGIWALGEIPREHADNPSGKRRVDGELVEDHIPDDQALAVETDDGIAVILGCGHSGLRNTVEYAEEVFDEKVHVVVGGTHLVGMDHDGLVETADWLAEKDSIEVVAPCHCTGFEAESILADRVDGRFESVGVGSTLDL